MYKQGDRVRVVGYGGKRAVLRVWEDKGKGLALCTEEGFRRAKEGGEVVAVGYPMEDIEGAADQPSGEYSP